MDEVRQAHLPGNYELHDESSSLPGLPICKVCWEKEGAKMSSSLMTVWMVADGRQSIWWLCMIHYQEVMQDATRRMLRSESKAVRYPPIERTST